VAVNKSQLITITLATAIGGLLVVVLAPKISEMLYGGKEAK
jgi:hypothetical protein